VTRSNIPELVEQLPKFKVRLAKNGEVVEEGSGRNSLRSPALCLAELATAMARQDGTEPLASGDLVSSGTLTESTPIQPGATWTASVEGPDLPTLTLRLQ
jgi:2-oxo-3-hexenedioate decarboxylase